MKKSALLVCAAGLACSSAAFAQSNSEDISNLGQIRVSAPSQGFGGRVLTVVYGAAVDLRGYSDGAFPKLSGDDFDFNPGPAGAVVGDIPVDGFYWGVVCPAGSTQTVTDTRLTIYDNFTGFVVGTFPGNTPLGNVTFTGLAGTPGFITYYDPTGIPTFTPAINVPNNVSGTDGFVTIETLDPGTTNVHPSNWVVTGGPGFAVGNSDALRWGDSNGDRLVQPVNGTGGALECNLASGPRRLYVGMRGDAPIPLPTPRESVPCLTDGTTTQTDPVPAAGVKWYEICLSGGADDDLLRYLDVDSEGSAIADTNLGLYTADGNLVGVSGLDRGSGLGAQLSFGVGRRAPLGDGEQYDGWNGDLDNSLGTQYIVGVSDGTATFGPAFTVNNTGGAGGSFTTNFRTNTVGGVNAASIVPVLNGVPYGTLTSGTNFGVAAILTRDTTDSVRWSEFTTDTALCAAGGSLALDFVTLSDGIADVVAWVFDASGNIIAFGDDGLGTPANKPDISFGAGGNSGDLLPGTYYIAAALFDPQNSDLSTVSGNDRFHVRGRSGSSLNVGANLELVPGSGATCAGTVCNDIDFNNDESLFDPQDIDALLSVFSEGDCIPNTQTCDSIDFNNDGGLFDPCDIASFLLVFQEGPCTPCGV